MLYKWTLVKPSTVPDKAGLECRSTLAGRYFRKPAAVAPVPVPQITSVTQAVQRAEMQVILQEAINGMDPLDREILALRHFEELSNAETAEVLEIKATTASTRHIRALKRLRESLLNTPGFFDKERE